MINRANYLDVKNFVAYLATKPTVKPTTVKRYWSLLRHLLEWADETLFPMAHQLNLTFPVYLTQVGVSRPRTDGKTGPLALETQRHACSVARLFFEWAIAYDIKRYRTITPLWLESLRPLRCKGHIKPRLEYTLDEVERLVDSISTDTLTGQRDRAAIAFLFLSGARIDAFVTLPIKAIDLSTMPPTLLQDPNIGVRTKNDRAARTFLLNIPSLLAVVRSWDAIVRQALPENALWYASLTTDGMGLTGHTEAGISRGELLAKSLRRYCERIDITYKTPHKLRHGHVAYGFMHAKDLDDAKAISQNVMHKNLATTESIYGFLGEESMRERILRLSGTPTPTVNLTLSNDQFQDLLRVMQHPGPKE